MILVVHYLLIFYCIDFRKVNDKVLHAVGWSDTQFVKCFNLPPNNCFFNEIVLSWTVNRKFLKITFGSCAKQKNNIYFWSNWLGSYSITVYRSQSIKLVYIILWTNVKDARAEKGSITKYLGAAVSEAKASIWTVLVIAQREKWRATAPSSEYNNQLFRSNGFKIKSRQVKAICNLCIIKTNHE